MGTTGMPTQRALAINQVESMPREGEDSHRIVNSRGGYACKTPTEMATSRPCSSAGLALPGGVYPPVREHLKRAMGARTTRGEGSQAPL